MYAVVYKNRVIVGPMVWNRGIFQGSLEKEKIETSLPRVAPEELPLVINEDAKIMAVEEVRPQMNPMVEYYYGPTWDLTGVKAIANYDVIDTPIEFAKINFKNQAAGERWKKEVAGTKINIQNTEVTIDTSRDGRNIFVQKYSLMTENETVNWKFPEGWLTLTKTELGDIVNGGASYIQSCFDWEKTINDEIDAATTKEQLLSIEIVEEQSEDIDVDNETGINI
jgi:hypothetical protein